MSTGGPISIGGHTSTGGLATIKATGRPKSTFYKWKPLVELKIIDAHQFHFYVQNNDDSAELLSKVKETLIEENYVEIAKDMRRKLTPFEKEMIGFCVWYFDNYYALYLKYLQLNLNCSILMTKKRTMFKISDSFGSVSTIDTT